MPHRSLTIAGESIAPGSRTRIDIPLPSLFTQNRVILPVHVLHGHRPGPRLFVTAAIHGDEINGIEIIRRLLAMTTLRHLHGTLLAVPVVNVYGFIRLSRYLPDRRDLNRSFPGSETGSLAARLATIVLQEVVRDSDLGIDLHTGAAHRDNLPQIRADLDEIGTLDLANAFGAPVIVNAEMRDGSLRAESATLGVPVLVYEGGEALRFNELAIRAGLRGLLGVMRRLGMLRRTRRSIPPPAALARSTLWARAPQSGVLRHVKPLGARVARDETLAIISDPFGDNDTPVTSPATGIVIGRTNLPLVTEGEALFHIARFGQTDAAVESVEQLQTLLDPPDDLFVEAE